MDTTDSTSEGNVAAQRFCHGKRSPIGCGVDMLQFDPQRWIAIIAALHALDGNLLLRSDPDPAIRAQVPFDLVRWLNETLDDASQRLYCSASTARQIERFRGRLGEMRLPLSSNDRQTLQAFAQDLSLALQEELKTQVFLAVRPENRELYLQAEPLFGAAVATAFPDATPDIAAAGRCYAVEEWTACVFHLMRVLECGLRSLAGHFNVPFTTDSWHKVIKGIEDGIAAERNKPNLTDADRATITAHSKLAAEFRHFKDAWRNHVSHGRAAYDAREAASVYEHVRSFMQHMAGAA
jgi:hypothetical protein